jgi:glutathione S-transferase
MPEELVFYTNPMSRGRIVRWMLEEVGQPYQTELLEYAASMKAPAYLAVNPMGKVPAIRHGSTVVTECAAICAYLADAFPQAGLAPPPAGRGAYYRWLFYAAGPVEAAVTNKAMGFQVPPGKEMMAGYGSFATVMDVLEYAVSQSEYIAGRCLFRLANRLGPAIRLHRKTAGVRGLLGQTRRSSRGRARPGDR